jgi:hypothetical protein
MAFFENKKLESFGNLGFMNLQWTLPLRKKRGENQNTIPNKETNSCLNGDFFDIFDYYDTRLDVFKWNPSERRQYVTHRRREG